MRIGIPYTKYSYNINLPKVPRILVFCVLCCLIYIFLSIPQTKRVVGSLTGYNKFDDIDSTDKYYLTIIHSVVFGLLIFLLLKIYNPFLVQKKNIIL